MDKIRDFLAEWIELYVKNKNVMLKNLESIEVVRNEVRVKYKDKEHLFIIEPVITEFGFFIDKLKEAPDSYISLVIFNSKENLKKIIEKWGILKKFKFFSVFFVNPFSQTDKKWIIYPYTHSKISDDESLELGLKTMSETVEPVTEEGVKKKIK